jgi:hypothetical protein
MSDEDPTGTAATAGESNSSSGVSDEERQRIIEEERVKWEEEKKREELENKARELEKIEQEKKAEEDRREAERKAKEEDERRKTERKNLEKEILAEEKKKSKGKGFGAGKAILLLLVAVAVIGAVGYLTFDAFGNQNPWGDTYPYVAQYDVHLPDSKEVSFGNVPVLAVTSGEQVTLKIGNDRRTFGLGETVEFPAKHMTVKMYGMALRESDYSLTVTYRGLVNNRLNFLIIARTSQSPMPGWMSGMIIPSDVLVRPV